MKHLVRLAMFTLFFSSLFCQDRPGTDKITFRPATVAGAFYPAKPEELRQMINGFLSDKKIRKFDDDVVAIVVPHAGYVYSGNIAAKAYAQLIGRKYDAVVIIAPSHHKYFYGASVFSGEGYTTPLGIVRVHKELCNEIAGRDTVVRLSMDGHSWQDSVNEHSLEVQLPFLQTVLPDVPVVPIIMGSQDFRTCDFLMRDIVDAVKKLQKKVLIIASSDLSHFHSDEDARNIDKPIPETFQYFDYFKLENMFFSRNLEACGGGPIVTAMMTAEQLGGNKAFSIKYATSFDSPDGKSSKDRVVGYFAGIVVKSEHPQPDLPQFYDQEKQEILNIAKESVETIVKDNKAKPAQLLLSLPSLTGYFTCFVTLKKHGELRACMGHTFPVNQLVTEIYDVARTAALSDYRFGPVKPEELKDIDYEVSVLSRFKRILDFNKIQIGNDGLYIRFRGNSGLLLPQVATERNWSVKTFLENVCLKAGLPKDTYQNPEAELYIFSARIINGKEN